MSGWIKIDSETQAVFTEICSHHPGASGEGWTECIPTWAFYILVTTFRGQPLIGHWWEVVYKLPSSHVSLWSLFCIFLAVFSMFPGGIFSTLMEVTGWIITSYWLPFLPCLIPTLSNGIFCKKQILLKTSASLLEKAKIRSPSPTHPPWLTHAP